MGKNPSFQFYPADWLNDIKLQTCSLSAQGLLINLMCLMHQSDRYGYLLINGSIPLEKDVIKLLRIHHKPYQAALIELLSWGVLSRDENGAIFCQRMVKDEEIREVRRKAGKMGGNPLLNQKVNQGVNQKPTPSSSSSSSISTKETHTPHTPQLPIIKDETVSVYAERFSRFWKAYPKKKSKGQAKKTWMKIKPSEQLLETILSTIERAKTSVDWQKENGRYIPHPATWLNAEGWEDEFVSIESNPDREFMKKLAEVKLDGADIQRVHGAVEVHYEKPRPDNGGKNQGILALPETHPRQDDKSGCG